ncbi:hypothetical protein RhiJN_00728 [Ceratobasidium sp. AG-Ba]|nr:hypothetical protein RhiJN_00728 [Ceratobasidium sp. AG-Ba]
MPIRSLKQGEPVRHSPYPMRERTKSNKSTLLESVSALSVACSSKPKRAKQNKLKPREEPIANPVPVLRSPLFAGINPLYLVRSMRAIARADYSYAHGYLHLCISQARQAASNRGGLSATVVCLLMLYSDNWLRLGIPSRAVASMEDVLAALEQMGEETDEEREQATLAGLELRGYMESHTAE